MRDIYEMSYADIDDWKNVIYADSIDEKLSFQDNLEIMDIKDKKKLTVNEVNKERRELKFNRDIAMGIATVDGEHQDFRDKWRSTL